MGNFKQYVKRLILVVTLNRPIYYMPYLALVIFVLRISYPLYKRNKTLSLTLKNIG